MLRLHQKVNCFAAAAIGGNGSTAGIAVGTSPITSGLPVILQESILSRG
jgi:hypothetical protein